MLTTATRTAGLAAALTLTADRAHIKANGTDLSFVTVQVTDTCGTPVPDAANLVQFSIDGTGEIIAVDNGYQADTSPFHATYKKTYNGKCLVIIWSKPKAGSIRLRLTLTDLRRRR